MSETVIFSFGIFVFMLTIWGAVVSGGIWLGRIAESEEESSQLGSVVTDGLVNDVNGTLPRRTGE
jgi:hypothetical protein